MHSALLFAEIFLSDSNVQVTSRSLIDAGLRPMQGAGSVLSTVLHLHNGLTERFRHLYRFLFSLVSPRIDDRYSVEPFNKVHTQAPMDVDDLRDFNSHEGECPSSMSLDTALIKAYQKVSAGTMFSRNRD